MIYLTSYTTTPNSDTRSLERDGNRCGKFESNSDGSDIPYMTVTVPRNGEDETLTNSYNPHYIRFYMEHVVSSFKPQVLLAFETGNC